MPRRKRDYKAEYARRKQRSISLGYKSPREEYKARKSLNFTRHFPSLRKSELPDFSHKALGIPLPDRRTESRAWSNRHAHKDSTTYDPNWSPEQKADYYKTFVEDFRKLGPSRRKRNQEKRKRIFRYMKKWDPDSVEGTEESWKSRLAE